MNGRLFLGLVKLEFVDLSGNECVDAKISEGENLSDMKQLIDAKCGFAENLNEGSKDIKLNVTDSQSISVNSAVIAGNDFKLKIFMIFILLVCKF